MARRNAVIVGLMCVLSIVGISLMAAEEAAKSAVKMTVRQDGKLQGAWAENQRCMMAVIASNDSIPKGFQDSIPYVAVYPKDETGKMPSLPYALNFSGGELQLQIPGADSKSPRIVSIRRINALLDAVENLNNAAR